MSAYRRLNRSSKSTAFQHPSMSVYQQQQHLNSHANLDAGSSNGNCADSGGGGGGNSGGGVGFAGSGGNDDRQLPNNNNNNSSNTSAYPTQPKHLRFPDGWNSEVLNELIMFAFAVIATAMQFLHLYRTVWWLPESHTSQSMNFYLIDTHLTLFILILLGRRFLYCLVLKVLETVCPRTIYSKVVRPLRIAIFASILFSLGLLCIQLFHKQRYVVIYLCYPLIVYVITFGLRIEPFLRTAYESDSSLYLNGIPTHSCSTNPLTIRAEIDVLRADYNNRFKQVVFTSLLNAYYSAFIPCCFAQSYLYYDLYWATQHLGFVVLGCLTMCMIFCFPAHYCDVMHMAALHLGQWTRVESRSYAPPAIAWSKLVVWPSGAFVKHSGELYKAGGIVTTAIPANGVHSRFYTFFQNPANLYLILSIVQSTIILIQIVILFMVVEWHNVISLSYLMLANYFTLFKIVRDFFVANRIYASECSYSDKSNTISTSN